VYVEVRRDDNMYMWGGGGSLHVVDAEGVQSVGD